MSCRESVGSLPIYLPFESGRWRMSLGLKALPLAEWIQIDDLFLSYLKRKAELLRERPAAVFAAIAGSEAGQQEVLELLLEHLLRYFPSYYERRDARVINRVTGEVWHLGDFEARPLDLAGRLVQEDLCLMMPSEEGYLLGAASLCFPLHWQLHDKLGKAIAPIHTPVPNYAVSLENPVNRYFDHLKPEAPGYRSNWSIVDSPELYLGNSRASRIEKANITSTNAGEKLWIRVERQTLRRLPATGHILFSIRTYIYPLSLLKQHSNAALGLLETIPQIPPEMQLYKSLLPIREALEDYLKAITISR